VALSEPRLLKKPNCPLTVEPVVLVMVSTKRAAFGTPALAKALVMPVGSPLGPCVTSVSRLTVRPPKLFCPARPTPPKPS